MRRAMLSCAIAAAIMIGTAAPAYVQELDKQIEELTKALGKLNNVEKKTSDLLTKLRAEVERIKCVTVECKLGLLGEFSKAIEAKIIDPDKLTPEQLKDPILAILPELLKLGAKHRAKDTAIAVTGAVTAALGSANPQQPDFVDTAEFETAITTLQKWQSPTVSATNRATELSVLLTSNKPKKDDAKLKAELAKLVTAIGNSEERIGPRLNIVQAWFGDFHFIKKVLNGRLRLNSSTGLGWRVCDATGEVRAACQGQKSCPFEKTNPAGNTPPAAKLEIDGDHLCGDNPAPHAAKSITGVVIEYQCLSVTKKRWDELESLPRPDESKKKVELAALRAGSTTTIRCESQAQ